MDPSTHASGGTASAVAELDSRQRILNAALELMAERGYAGTSISMVTKRSGLPASSTYWHFGSKEALLAAVVEYSAIGWMASLPRWDDLQGSPAERLSALLDQAAASLASQPFLKVLMLLSLEQPHMDGEWLESVRRVRHSAAGGLRKAFAETFTSAHDPDVQAFSSDLATFALAVTDGIFLASEIDANVDIPKMFRFLRTAFLALGTEYMSRKDAPAA
jgi:AcrR family transcriptional regulator